MLHTGLTLPGTDQEIAQVVHNTFADLDLGTVADELGRSAAFTNIVLKRIELESRADEGSLANRCRLQHRLL